MNPESKKVKTRFFVTKKNIGSVVWLLLAPAIFSCNTGGDDTAFVSQLPEQRNRIWIGSSYWANPLQDWRLENGRIECQISGGDRSLFLLTHHLADHPGEFTLSVRLGKQAGDEDKPEMGFAGFYIGVRGKFNDYRDDAVHGRGFPAGITTAGKLFIADLSEAASMLPLPLDDLRLEISSQQVDTIYSLTLKALDNSGKLMRVFTYPAVSPSWLAGGVSLVCHRGERPALPQLALPRAEDSEWQRPSSERGGNVTFWYTDWRLNGSKVKRITDQAHGPILFTHYTLSGGVMKLTAQMPPVGAADPAIVRLEVQGEESKWKQISEAHIDTLSRTATFRIEQWNSKKDIPYRLVYGPFFDQFEARDYYYFGKIRKEPGEKEEIVVAAFTGNNDLGFPNSDITRQLKIHDPDLMFFSGDQIYEGVARYGIEREPLASATLDYLRKWYLYGWAYGEFLKDRPSISIPDDHDVYHGNIWGEAGIAAPSGKSGYAAQDPGGYRMNPHWVNMVQRTQTSHLPDPYDPQPVAQGIGVYFSQMTYAGISFAILEDRKFKSAPQRLLPEARVVNGWVQNPDFDVRSRADVPGAVLLGRRQLEFLDSWAADWSDQIWMKVVLSQTIFSNVATLPGKNSLSDKIVPKLRIMKAGEYPPDDWPVSDMDSNGWPQTGRNLALRAMRKAFAFHIAGDQHLGSTIQYGIDTWRDAGYAFCVPAISNVWPRRWYPAIAGKNKNADRPSYTGDFEDGFGNKMTVLAVSNPIYSGYQPGILYDRATGYGIVRFKRDTREIVIECWPRLADPSGPDAEQYPGWPLTLHQFAGIFSTAPYYLPGINVEGVKQPVLKVFDQTNDQLIYALRLSGQSVQPAVFRSGLYKIVVGEPGTDRIKTFSDLSAEEGGNDQMMNIKF